MPVIILPTPPSSSTTNTTFSPSYPSSSSSLLYLIFILPAFIALLILSSLLGIWWRKWREKKQRERERMNGIPLQSGGANNPHNSDNRIIQHDENVSSVPLPPLSTITLPLSSSPIHSHNPIAHLFLPSSPFAIVLRAESISHFDIGGGGEMDGLYKESKIQNDNDGKITNDENIIESDGNISHQSDTTPHNINIKNSIVSDNHMYDQIDSPIYTDSTIHEDNNNKILEESSHHHHHHVHRISHLSQSMSIHIEENDNNQRNSGVLSTKSVVPLSTSSFSFSQSSPFILSPPPPPPSSSSSSSPSHSHPLPPSLPPSHQDRVRPQTPSSVMHFNHNPLMMEEEEDEEEEKEREREREKEKMDGVGKLMMEFNEVNHNRKGNESERESDPSMFNHQNDLHQSNENHNSETTRSPTPLSISTPDSSISPPPPTLPPHLNPPPLSPPSLSLPYSASFPSPSSSSSSFPRSPSFTLPQKPIGKRSSLHSKVEEKEKEKKREDEVRKKLCENPVPVIEDILYNMTASSPFSSSSSSPSSTPPLSPYNSIRRLPPPLPSSFLLPPSSSTHPPQNDGKSYFPPHSLPPPLPSSVVNKTLPSAITYNTNNHTSRFPPPLPSSSYHTLTSLHSPPPLPTSSPHPIPLSRTVDYELQYDYSPPVNEVSPITPHDVINGVKMHHVHIKRGSLDVEEESVEERENGKNQNNNQYVGRTRTSSSPPLLPVTLPTPAPAPALSYSVSPPSSSLSNNANIQSTAERVTGIKKIIQENERISFGHSADTMSHESTGNGKSRGGWNTMGPLWIREGNTLKRREDVISEGEWRGGRGLQQAKGKMINKTVMSNINVNAMKKGGGEKRG